MGIVILGEHVEDVDSEAHEFFRVPRLADLLEGRAYGIG